MRLILVLGDQLTPSLSALRAGDRARDRVVMAEVAAETGYVPHHPKKIALVLAAMRKFAKRLREDGWTVDYTTLDDPDNAGSIPGELLRWAGEHGADRVIATRPGEWRLIEALESAPVPVQLLDDDRFISTQAEFDAWAKSRKTLRMEHFYREMRRKTGLLLAGDEPAGGRWNFDSENRKPASDDLFAPKPLWFEPDKTVQDVLDLVEGRFADNFGTLRPFGFATDAEQAERVLDHFLEHALPYFGDYQDAMLTGNRFLYHGLVSAYLNIGLLDPLDVCKRAEKAWQEGNAPLNCVEGFIRQILGWREYVRRIYVREGPDYPQRNALDHQRALPPLFWGAETRMNCLHHAIGQTRDEAYAHHIQRLMVIGNFALLAGLNPTALHEWYLAVYFDAFEWVEAPNTVGMSQFADGGIIASKPYVSSGNYIDKMSDYCGGCAYSVKQKSGEGACPFNLLYWAFLDRHRARFARNPRMAAMYGTWDRMDAAKRTAILSEAETFLSCMSRGEPV